MSAAISSAQPFKLFRYSDVTTGIDRDLVSEANWLGDLLRNFEARCTEYPVRVSHLADSLRDHARTAESVDRWVHSVGQGFERADRGYAATWGLRGQGVFSAQAAAFIDRLVVSGAFAQRWSLALQIFKTKWALNEAILRLRYQVFMLKYAPWFDRALLPWDLYEKYQSLLAGALIASSIRFGHAYSGQIIINLPDFLRNFGFSLREIRTWAGLSGHLTHIKYTNLPSHMFWASLALSIPSLVSKWSSDIVDYGSGEYTGTELASALTVDTALTLAPVAASYVGAKVGVFAGAKLGALIGTAVAPGVGTVIGGAIGAIAGGVIAGWATKEVIERTDIREKAIPWLDEHVFGPLARMISEGVDQVTDWVDAAARRMQQDFDRIVAGTASIVNQEREAIKQIQAEGVPQLDETVKAGVDHFVPPDSFGEEFTGVKVKGDVDIVASGVPLYIEGGGDVRITRDESGNYVVTIEGMAGVGLNLEQGTSTTGKIDAEAGVRGQVTTEYTFDPEKQGDMTAMARLLAEMGLTLTAAGILGPAGAVIVGGTSSAIGAVGGAQVNYDDNLTGLKAAGGLRSSFEASLPGGITSVSEEKGFMIQAGWETGDDGEKCHFVSYLRHREEERSLLVLEGHLAIDAEYKVRDNPPGVEAIFRIEPEVGLSADMFKDALIKKGLPVSVAVDGSCSLELRVHTDWDVQAIQAAVFTDEGDFDLSALQGMGALEIYRISRLDGSLDVDLAIVEAEGSAYIGRKEKLYSDEWGERI